MELSRLKQLLGIDEGDTSKDVSLSFVISDVEEIIKIIVTLRKCRMVCSIQLIVWRLICIEMKSRGKRKPLRVLFHLLVRVILPYH